MGMRKAVTDAHSRRLSMRTRRRSLVYWYAKHAHAHSRKHVDNLENRDHTQTHTHTHTHSNLHMKIHTHKHELPHELTHMHAHSITQNRRGITHIPQTYIMAHTYTQTGTSP
jgi:hypothetical protein